jgi:hypothetical protein
MSHVEGIDRDQMTLFPEALDDYVSEENPVRFIDAFVGSLDLEGLDFTHAVPNELGRPPYNPADLLRLFIYGYLNRVRSSRQLEREANRNVELMWLLRRLAVETRVVAPAEDQALSALLLFHRQILGARCRVPPCAILRTRHYQSVSVWRSNGNKNRLAVRGKPKWGIIGRGRGSSIMSVAWPQKTVKGLGPLGRPESADPYTEPGKRRARV